MFFLIFKYLFVPIYVQVNKRKLGFLRTSTFGMLTEFVLVECWTLVVDQTKLSELKSDNDYFIIFQYLQIIYCLIL